MREPETLAKHLYGRRPERAEYAQALRNVKVSEYIMGLTTEHLLDLLDP